jgi:hypothetical protein
MNVQRLISVVKMATVLEECTVDQQCSVMRFLWAKVFNAKYIRNEMFPVYGGKCLSHKAFHNWVEKFSQERSKVADNDPLGAEVTETTVKRLVFCGVRRTGKAMGQMYQSWWRKCREINVFPRFEYHILYVLYLFVTYMLILPRILVRIFPEIRARFLTNLCRSRLLARIANVAVLSHRS